MNGWTYHANWHKIHPISTHAQQLRDADFVLSLPPRVDINRPFIGSGCVNMPTRFKALKPSMTSPGHSHLNQHMSLVFLKEHICHLHWLFVSTLVTWLHLPKGILQKTKTLNSGSVCMKTTCMPNSCQNNMGIVQWIPYRYRMASGEYHAVKHWQRWSNQSYG